MVSLISQNAVPKDRLDKGKRKADDKPSIPTESSEQIDDRLVSDMQAVSRGRRRKSGKKRTLN